tara:strand:- start:215 stop:628 length:414 start_codon:yes stop_codon:yes gene_type:complete
MNDYDKIANLVISLTEIDIFENRKTQKHVDARAFFDYIMRKVKNKTFIGIAKYYNTKGKKANHTTILYRVNLFEEIKKRRPEFNNWQRLIEQTTVSAEDLLLIMNKLKSLENIESIEQVVEILDVLKEEELENMIRL